MSGGWAKRPTPAMGAHTPIPCRWLHTTWPLQPPATTAFVAKTPQGFLKPPHSALHLRMWPKKKRTRKEHKTATIPLTALTHTRVSPPLMDCKAPSDRPARIARRHPSLTLTMEHAPLMAREPSPRAQGTVAAACVSSAPFGLSVAACTAAVLWPEAMAAACIGGGLLVRDQPIRLQCYWCLCACKRHTRLARRGVGRLLAAKRQGTAVGHGMGMKG